MITLAHQDMPNKEFVACILQSKTEVRERVLYSY